MIQTKKKQTNFYIFFSSCKIAMIITYSNDNYQDYRPSHRLAFLLLLLYVVAVAKYATYFPLIVV